MAVQVTGFFQNPQTGLIYESPLLTLVPHLQYAGQIAMDVFIASNGAVGYQSIDKSTLTYDATITDAYTQLIDALDTYVINNLKRQTSVTLRTSNVNIIDPITGTHDVGPDYITGSGEDKSLVTLGSENPFKVNPFQISEKVQGVLNPDNAGIITS